MSNETDTEQEKKFPVQFYCNEEEQGIVKSAAEKTFRSAASFSKYHTLKAAQAINEGKVIE